MSVTLRSACLGDTPAVVEFNRRLALETENTLLDPGVLERGVRAVLADPNRGLYFVAERAGQVIGQVMITTEWSDWRNGWIWWFQSVYVNAEDRRSGVFRALGEYVLAEARRRGDVRAVRLYVERHNVQAQAVYRRLGLDDAGYFVMERVLDANGVMKAS